MTAIARLPRNYKSVPAEPARARIESLDQDGRGVAHIDGKAVFIEGALPGEDVLFTYRTRRKRYDEGVVAQVLTPSPARVTPQCAHFGVCGGCSLQHLASAAQIEAKQQILLDALEHIGKVRPNEIIPPLHGPAWGYRRKARLGAKYVIKKEKMLVGFREKRSALLADLTRCEILHPAVGARLPELRALLMRLESYNQIPQIEVAVGDENVALVFRHLAPLDEQDREQLRNFGQAHAMQIYLQPAGPDSVTLLWPVAPGVLPPVTLAHPCASVAPGVLPPVTLAHPCASVAPGVLPP
ncbi:MAG: TRAM domain-containing protein, partial [Pseudomonadota bacterium]